MRKQAKSVLVGVGVALSAFLISPLAVHAGSLGWLDEVVQQAVREADVGGRAVARGEARVARSGARLFSHEAEASLETLARRADLGRLAKGADTQSEAALKQTFRRLVKPDAAMARTFDALGTAEKRLVIEMGEAAQMLARRYPGQADVVIRKLGVEGLSAVRAYGDDVAEVIVKEGPESVNILRKTGRGGWAFFNEKVLPHKKALVAAGVFSAFVANPQLFVDTAGNATQFAVEQFAKAGIQLAGAIGGGAARGFDRALGNALASFGIDHPILRWLIAAAALLVATGALLTLLGKPLRWILAPVTIPLRLLQRRSGATACK